MLIDFFYTLRSAKLPVSVQAYLMLLEALQAGVVGPTSSKRTKAKARGRLMTSITSAARCW
jgi:uncharacterized protein with von Willebrand factor type A (vWA) domain